MEEKTTPCECPLAGYCNRHKMNKSPHFHHLCGHNAKYFNMWEQCRGPGQEFSDCVDKPKAELNVVYPEKKKCGACSKQTPQVVEPPTQEELKANLPSLWEQAKSLTGAVAKHVATGMNTTKEDMREKRLEICNSCEFLIKDHKKCGKCGCFVELKTKLESASCPIGRW